jgi:hypothetical protein
MNTQTQANFEAFTTELAELSKKYGVVLTCIGGVSFAERDDELLATLRYTNDSTSGDLEPIFTE